MHNLTKIKIFRVLLWLTYPVSLLLIYPFVLLKNKKNRLVFFFDRYSIGGAQKIHMDILESVKDIPKTIYFTRKSPDDKLKHVFYSTPNSECHDIHFWCDNLLFRLFSVHYYAFLINSIPNAMFFSSNSTFFYDVLPFIRDRVQKVELLHNFTYGKRGMEFFGLANYKYLDIRLVYDNYTYSNMIRQYKDFNVPELYISRIKLIEYGVAVPDHETEKNVSPPLNVLYAGRGAAQKRIWLLNRIVEHFLEKNLNIQFTFAGSMTKELSDLVKQKCVVHSEIGDKNEMDKLFREAHVIILTSAFEGFPVVIKEGMSFGCIPVVTALPGNIMHLKHLKNALLMHDYENEESVVKEGIANLNLLLQRTDLVTSLSSAAYKYAKDHFRKDKFLREYREMLLN